MRTRLAGFCLLAACIAPAQALDVHARGTSQPAPATDAGSLEPTIQRVAAAGHHRPGPTRPVVIGVEVVDSINAEALPGVLANYTLARPLNTTANCTDAAGAVAACP